MQVSPPTYAALFFGLTTSLKGKRARAKKVQKVIGDVKVRCRRCGRLQPSRQINIEATIHHRRPPECFDRKDCERARRKAKRKTKE